MCFRCCSFYNLIYDFLFINYTWLFIAFCKLYFLYILTIHIDYWSILCIIYEQNISIAKIFDRISVLCFNISRYDSCLCDLQLYLFFSMNMKKYTRSSVKGFTLVELIVVIVILSILATIAFLSFTSQSASARDSKRKTDISGIVWKINVFLAQKGNSAATQLVTSDNKRQLTNPSIAWQASTSGTNYIAGKINYANLGVSSTDFMDSKDGNSYDYAFWVTTLQGTAYQLASKLEVDDSGNPITDGAYVMGSYTARWTGSTWIAFWTWVYTNSSAPYTVTITLPSNMAGFFDTGDIIANTWTMANTWVIKSISNGWVLTISTQVAWAATSFSWVVWISLAQQEVWGLIMSTKSGTGIVTSARAPY